MNAKAAPRVWMHWLLQAAILAAVGLGVMWGWGKAAGGHQPESGFVTTALETGAVRATVRARGTVEPRTQVNVGTHIGGLVAKVHFDFNERVNAGDVLVEIDPDQARSEMRVERATLDAKKATLAAREVDVRVTDAESARAEQLLRAGVSHDRELLIAKAEAERAKARLRSARAEALAQEALVDRSQAALRRTKIIAPISGIVIRRNVESGSTVVVGPEMPPLFVIASDLAQMRVIADIDEADVGGVRAGQAATLSVDAYPGLNFEGKIRQIRLGPNREDGLVTYPAEIDVPNPQGVLRPGMTATVEVLTGEATNALLVDNAALRFRAATEDAPELPRGKGRLYTLSSEGLVSHEVALGVTDGHKTQIVAGDLPVGAQVVVEALSPPGAAQP